MPAIHHSIDFAFDEGLDFYLTKVEMQEVVEVVLQAEEVERSCNLSISVVTDKRIQEINAEFRGKDVPTDVISIECERPDDPDLFENEVCELGDIVLAPAYIAAQAKRFGTTAKNESTLLLVHGLLHLLGYDHILDKDAQVMEAREDELVEMLIHDATLGHIELTRHSEDEM